MNFFERTTRRLYFGISFKRFTATNTDLTILFDTTCSRKSITRQLQHFPRHNLVLHDTKVASIRLQDLTYKRPQIALLSSPPHLAYKLTHGSLPQWVGPLLGNVATITS